MTSDTAGQSQTTDDAATTAARDVEQFYSSHFGDALQPFGDARWRAPCSFCSDPCDDPAVVIVRARWRVHDPHDPQASLFAGAAP